MALPMSSQALGLDDCTNGRQSCDCEDVKISVELRDLTAGPMGTSIT